MGKEGVFVWWPPPLTEKEYRKKKNHHPFGKMGCAGGKKLFSSFEPWLEKPDVGKRKKGRKKAVILKNIPEKEGFSFFKKNWKAESPPPPLRCH